jgi:3D (Asp-Asp-Asp) domain-containing protein
LRPAEFIKLASVASAAFTVILLAGCETTTKTARRLPSYEPRLAKSDFQSVRTTAYTHTEADHTQYTNHNALGGQLQAASAPIHRAENTPRELAVGMEEQSDYQRVAYSGSPSQPFSMAETHKTTKVTKTTRNGKKVVVTRTKAPKIGSAAADWSRWPAGTTFRLLSTGQLYRVDDYGWALSGRNTIDLYMATSHEMNSWGSRQESIQILKWGDPQESLRLLEPHQNSRHIKRMILQLEGNEQEAAALQ